jgi:hypothetical protein
MHLACTKLITIHYTFHTYTISLFPASLCSLVSSLLRQFALGAYLLFGELLECKHFDKKISLPKTNIMGIYYPIGTGKKRLHQAHSFGMFLIKKKSAKVLQQISGPHTTCKEVVVGTIMLYMWPPVSGGIL